MAPVCDAFTLTVPNTPPDATPLRATGCSGPMAARLAILKAARQLAVEAGVFVHVRKFSVINEVRPLCLNPHVFIPGPQRLGH